MERVLNGKFDDPKSTRDIIGITKDEYELLKHEFLFIKEQINLVNSMNFDDFANHLKNNAKSIAEINNLNPDEIGEESLKMMGSPEVIEQIKLISEAKLKCLINLENKVSIQKDSVSIIGITPLEYEVLITLLSERVNIYYMMVNNAEESDGIKALKVLTDLVDNTKEDSHYITHPLVVGFKDDKDRKARMLEMCETMMTTLYSWLQVINAPYEGAVYE